MISLRKAKERDLSAIQMIAKATWVPTYVPLLGREQVDFMLKKMYSKGALLGDMMKGHVFLIAEVDGLDLGFASYSITDHKKLIYKLHKLYVLPRAHGKGIGKVLINEITDKLKKAGARGLELNVNRKNKARDFYEKAGFSIKETVDIAIGNGFFMNDYVMEKRL